MCMCVCVCVCVGGYSGIFIYIRRLGPFLGVQNLGGGGEGGFRNIIILGDFVDTSLQNWTGFRGHFYTFQVFYLRSKCRMGI